MSKKLDSGFEIISFSDLSYENMSVEIQHSGEQIAQLNSDNNEIELFTDFLNKDFKSKFKLKDLLEAISIAESTLHEYNSSYLVLSKKF